MRKTHGLAGDLGLLALRATVGGLLAGHGAQKLFGSFGGHGLEGTAGWLESLGMRPGRPWAVVAGGSEFAGGVLTALGLLHPIGPVMTFGPMAMAWAKVHAGKPIWVTSGGAELPLLNLSAAAALGLTGPGRISLDRLLGLRVPPLVAAAGLAGVAAGIAAGLLSEPASAPADAREENQDEPAGGPTPPDPTPGVGLSAPSPGSPVEALGPALDGEAMRMNEAGTVAYGGLGAELPPEQPELAKEVGADPPGAFAGWHSPTGAANPRPAADSRGDEAGPRPRD